MPWSVIRRRNGVPIETLPGRKAETDRVCEGISEGFRLAKSERAVPGGVGAEGSCRPASGGAFVFLEMV
jgi:hypothetical protein